jgi:hypothetical protein
VKEREKKRGEDEEKLKNKQSKTNNNFIKNKLPEKKRFFLLNTN